MNKTEELTNLVTELPVVSESIANPIYSRIDNDENYIKTIPRKLVKEDSVITWLSLFFLSKNFLGEEPVVHTLLSVYEMLKMSGPLPEVTTEALKDVLQKYTQTEYDYKEEISKMIKEKNPEIDKFVDKFTADYRNPEGIKYAVNFMYGVLERQAELNKLKIKLRNL